MSKIDGMWTLKEIAKSTWLMLKGHWAWTGCIVLIIGLSLNHAITGTPFAAKGGGYNHIDASPLWGGLLFASIGIAALGVFWYCLHVARFEGLNHGTKKIGR